MSQLFLGNFDFEHLLAGGNHRSLPAPIQRINAELATCWMLVAQENDFLLLPEPVEEEFWKRMQSIGFPVVKPILSGEPFPANLSTDALHFTPWGWSKEMFQFAKQYHLLHHAPLIDSILQANSRRFSAKLEEEFQVALPTACMLTSLEEFFAAVEQLPTEQHRWVVKNEFSNSARERILGQGKSATEAEQNWMCKRWKNNTPLFFEPWVDAIEEAGIHFTIPKEGEPTFEGVTPLLTDASGRYCGSRVVPHENQSTSTVWQTAIEIGHKVALRLQKIGYFGPVGIDAMRFRQQDRTVGLRPLQEINARWTMGRLALGLRKLLQRGEVASWLHLSSTERISPPNDLENVRIISTSPTHVNGQPLQHQTLLCIADDVDLLEKCEQRLFNAK